MDPRRAITSLAIAVKSLLGTPAKVTQDRGRVVEGPYGACLVTTHPSSILRIEEAEEREAAYELFVADLRSGLDFLGRRRASASRRRGASA